MSKENSKRNRRFALMIAAAVTVSAPGMVRAQNEGVMDIVVPFAAGSTIDVLARVIASKLPEVSQHKYVIVENRSGAAGIVGTAHVARAKPDGNTILIQANGLTTTPAVRDDLPYDLQKDLVPLSLIGLAPYGIVVPANSPFHTLQEAFDSSKAKKEPIVFGTSGPGSQSDFVLAQIARLEKVNFQKIPYKGQGDILVAVMGSQVQMAMINMPSAIQQARKGIVRILATMTQRRTAATPDIPTLTEAGVPGLNESAWYGLLTTAGTPPAVVDALSKDLQQVFKQPDVRSKLDDLGIDTIASTPGPFKERLANELVRYKQLAKEENIKVE